MTNTPNSTPAEELKAAREEIAQLKAALAKGQENCDAEYATLREERDQARREAKESALQYRLLQAANFKHIEKIQKLHRRCQAAEGKLQRLQHSALIGKFMAVIEEQQKSRSELEKLTERMRAELRKKA